MGNGGRQKALPLTPLETGPRLLPAPQQTGARSCPRSPRAPGKRRFSMKWRVLGGQGLVAVPRGPTHQPWQPYRLQQLQQLHLAPGHPGRHPQGRLRVLQRGRREAPELSHPGDCQPQPTGLSTWGDLCGSSAACKTSEPGSPGRARGLDSVGGQGGPRWLLWAGSSGPSPHPSHAFLKPWRTHAPPRGGLITTL